MILEAPNDGTPPSYTNAHALFYCLFCQIEQVELVPGLKGAEELPLDYSLTEPPLGSALPRLYGFSRDPTTGQGQIHNIPITTDDRLCVL